MIIALTPVAFIESTASFARLRRFSLETASSGILSSNVAGWCAVHLKPSLMVGMPMANLESSKTPASKTPISSLRGSL